MSEHSPEPWEISIGFESHFLHDGKGMCITDLHQLGAENAKRIVACVNACEGISTYLLNKITAERGGILKDVKEFGVCAGDLMLGEEFQNA